MNRNWLWSVLLFELGTLQLMFLLKYKIQYWWNKKTPKTLQSWRHQKSIINRQAFSIVRIVKNIFSVCNHFLETDSIERMEGSRQKRQRNYWSEVWDSDQCVWSRLRTKRMEHDNCDLWHQPTGWSITICIIGGTKLFWKSKI